MDAGRLLRCEILLESKGQGNAVEHFLACFLRAKRLLPHKAASCQIFLCTSNLELHALDKRGCGRLLSQRKKPQGTCSVLLDRFSHLHRDKTFNALRDLGGNTVAVWPCSLRWSARPGRNGRFRTVHAWWRVPRWTFPPSSRSGVLHPRELSCRVVSAAIQGGKGAASRIARRRR